MTVRRPEPASSNLLTDPVLSLPAGPGISLPGLLAAMARGEAGGVPALRPHQRPAWHMFLVQLGALAAWRTPGGALPEDEAAWTAALRRLTPEHADDAPWRLAVPDGRKPAFLQPPVPESARQAKWFEVETPDALDMLITARNHDLKATVAWEAAAEDWIHALVSLQTCEGYGGRGNYGIARMNGGSASRPMLGLAPAREGCACPDPSAWWRRDVERLLASRRTEGPETEARPALLWCLDWPEGAQLDPGALDPWFIEVCRRVRLDWRQGRLAARRSGSRKPRIDALRLQGRTGDPWTPVHRGEGKSLTLGGGDFDCRRLCALLFSGDWETPLLGRAGDGESGPMLLVAEAFARGNIKTEGFRSRIVPIPAGAASELVPGTAAAGLAAAQLDEIAGFDRALRDALALMAAGGGAVRKEHYRHGFAARDRLAARADRLFFGSLWRRMRAQARGEGAAAAAASAFLADLLRAAAAELESALPAMPCRSALRPQAATQARRRFRNRLWAAHSAVLERELRALAGHEEASRGPAEAARAAARLLAGLAPDALAEARRGDEGTGFPAFWRLAARHPGTIGHPDRRAAWMAAVRILAILSDGTGGAARPRRERRLGEALCDGGDPRAWPSGGGRWLHPVFSERRLAQLLAARGARRAVLLARAARMLVRSRARDDGVDPADIALALLAPEEGQQLAGPYYRRLNRARWDAGWPRQGEASA